MKKRGKLPSDEDKKLWRTVTQTVTAYRPETMVDSFDPKDIDYVDLKKPTPAGPSLNGAPKRSTPDPYQPPISRPSVAKKGSPQKTLNPIERPVHRKISKGRVAIDARIDLHGMTQQVAYHALYQFLFDAYQRADRHVLVITGKGTSSGGHGVLKKAVPEWFNNPDFSNIVSGYKFSAQHHGGEGALYVRLRREKGPRP